MMRLSILGASTLLKVLIQHLLLQSLFWKKTWRVFRASDPTTWEYRECVLAVRELVGKHDSESMAYILLEIIEEFKFQAKVSISWIGINFS